MKTLTIALPESMESFVNDRVVTGGYQSVSDYVRELIAVDQNRDHIDRLLHEGLQSGPSLEMTPEFWEERKRKVTEADGS